MTTAKRQHYVPVFNLALFTPTDSRDDFLFVMRVPSGEQLRLRPREIGFEKYFYRVPDVPEVEPDFFETALAEFENRAAPAICRLVDAERMPGNSSKDRGTIINYLALQAARVPATRQRLAEIISFEDHLRLRAAAASPERVRARMTELRAAEGGAAPDEADVEAFVRMVRERAYVIERDQGEHVLNAIQMHDTILQALALRWWSVLVRRSPPFFVTSDNPVALAWGSRPPHVPRRPAPFDSPGFGLRFTEVTFPVSRHVALLGTFERPPALTFSATDKMVASVNSRTISGAARFVAAPTDEIFLFDPELRIVTTDALPAILLDLAARRQASRDAELGQLDRLVPLPASTPEND